MGSVLTDELDELDDEKKKTDELDCRQLYYIPVLSNSGGVASSVLLMGCVELFAVDKGYTPHIYS